MLGLASARTRHVVATSVCTRSGPQVSPPSFDTFAHTSVSSLLVGSFLRSSQLEKTNPFLFTCTVGNTWLVSPGSPFTFTGVKEAPVLGGAGAKIVPLLPQGAREDPPACWSGVFPLKYVTYTS